MLLNLCQLFNVLVDVTDSAPSGRVHWVVLVVAFLFYKQCLYSSVGQNIEKDAVEALSTVQPLIQESKIPCSHLQTTHRRRPGGVGTGDAQLSHSFSVTCHAGPDPIVTASSLIPSDMSSLSILPTVAVLRREQMKQPGTVRGRWICR